MTVIHSAGDRPGPQSEPLGNEAEAERWLGEGGQDRRTEPQEVTETPAQDEREDSITNIDQNATEEASDAQSASDAADREAASPADQGGEA